ncbi:hypothetical protein B0H19DRAFT_1071968 [Mycena capillaripes]|nr:hypothetical protein B0H19DRAFT_1071968 [Mycena capillaripes]
MRWGVDEEIGGATGSILVVGARGEMQGWAQCQNACCEHTEPTGEGIGGVNGGRSMREKVGEVGSQNMQTAESMLRVCGASCGAQNRDRDAMGWTKGIGGVNRQITVVERMGKGRSGWRTKMGAANTRSQWQGPKSRQRCGVAPGAGEERWEQAGSQNVHCKRAEPAAGHKIEVDMRWGGPKAWQCAWTKCGSRSAWAKAGVGWEPKHVRQARGASYGVQNRGRYATGMTKGSAVQMGEFLPRECGGKGGGGPGAKTRKASARSQLRGLKLRSTCGGGKQRGLRCKWASSGSQSARAKVGPGGEQKHTRRARGASYRFQNPGQHAAGVGQGIGAVNGRIMVAKAQGRRPGWTGNQNECGKRAEPATGSKIEVDIRWGWARDWWCKWASSCSRSARAKVDMRRGWAKGMTLRMGKFRRLERAARGTDLTGISSGFEMRRTYSTCLGNSRGPGQVTEEIFEPPKQVTQWRKTRLKIIFRHRGAGGFERTTLPS